MRHFLAILILLLSVGAVRADITSNLVAHWKLDETSGTSAADSSGNGNTGTYVNTPTLGVTGAFGSSKAVTFASASSQRMTNAALTWSSVSAACTVAAWIKPTSVTTYPSCVGNAAESTNNGSLFLTTTGTIDFRMGGSVIGTNRLVSSGTVPNGSWTHVVVTWDGTTLTIYRNAASDISDNTMSLAWPASNVNLGGITGFYYNGSLDDVRIYSRALSADDVAELYAYTGASKFPYWYFQSGGLRRNPFDVLAVRQPLAILKTR